MYLAAKFTRLACIYAPARLIESLAMHKRRIGFEFLFACKQIAQGLFAKWSLFENNGICSLPLSGAHFQQQCYL